MITEDLTPDQFERLLAQWHAQQIACAEGRQIFTCRDRWPARPKDWCQGCQRAEAVA